MEVNWSIPGKQNIAKSSFAGARISHFLLDLIIRLITEDLYIAELHSFTVICNIYSWPLLSLDFLMIVVPPEKKINTFTKIRSQDGYHK